MSPVEWLVVIAVAVGMLGIIAASCLATQARPERRLEVSDTFLLGLPTDQAEAAARMAQLLTAAGFDLGRWVTKSYDARRRVTVFTQER